MCWEWSRAPHAAHQEIWGLKQDPQKPAEAAATGMESLKKGALLGPMALPKSQS